VQAHRTLKVSSPVALKNRRQPGGRLGVVMAGKHLGIFIVQTAEPSWLITSGAPGACQRVDDFSAGLRNTRPAFASMVARGDLLDSMAAGTFTRLKKWNGLTASAEIGVWLFAVRG